MKTVRYDLSATYDLDSRNLLQKLSLINFTIAACIILLYGCPPMMDSLEALL